MKSKKTTKRHFEIFKKEAELWLDKFGLHDWRVTFVHEDHNDFEARAWFSAQDKGRIAVIGLSTDWGSDPITPLHIKVSALHEVLHVMFANMAIAAEQRYAPRNRFEEEEHAAIRRLEKVFYGRTD